MTSAAILPQRSAWRGGLALRVIQSVVWSLLITAVLIFLAGKNPLVAYQHIVLGAFGSVDRIVVGLNKAAPYMLAGVGVALCFRGNIANMGAEGQIAIGGLTASVVALNFTLQFIAPEQRTALLWRHPDPYGLWSVALTGRSGAMRRRLRRSNR